MLEGSISKTSWTKVTLGDVAINSTVATLSPEDDGFVRYVIGKHIPGDGDKITTWNEVGDGEFGSRIRTIIKQGDIICTTRGPNLRVAVATFDCLSAHTNFVLRTKDSSAVMQEFLQAIACSEAFQEHLRLNFRGSTNLFVNWSDAAAFEFLLPPIQEQARLVEALSALRLSRESLRTASDELSILKASFVSQVINESNAAGSQVKVADLLIDGPTNGRSPAPSGIEDGFKAVSISAVRNGIFDPEGCIKYVEMTVEEAGPFTVRLGDIFAIRGNGNRNICGRVGVSPKSYPDLVYPDLLIRMRFDQTKILPDFLIAQWNHPAVHGKLLSRAKSSNGIWKINGQDIRAHTLVVPHIDVQKKASKVLDDLEFRFRSIEKKSTQLRDIQLQLSKAISGGAE